MRGYPPSPFYKGSETIRCLTQEHPVSAGHGLIQDPGFVFIPQYVVTFRALDRGQDDSLLYGPVNVA